MSLLDRFLTDEHLTSDEYSAAVDGLSEPTAAAHLLRCRRCRCELGRWNRAVAALSPAPSPLDSCGRPQRDLMVAKALSSLGDPPPVILLNQGTRIIGAPAVRRKWLAPILVAAMVGGLVLLGSAVVSSSNRVHPSHSAAPAFASRGALRSSLMADLRGSPPEPGFPCHDQAARLMGVEFPDPRPVLVRTQMVDLDGRSGAVFVYSTKGADQALVLATGDCTLLASFAL